MHIHKGSAYLLSGDDCRMGTYFPAIIPYPIFCFCVFVKYASKIEKGQWKTGLDETCLIDQIEFENMIKEMKQEYVKIRKWNHDIENHLLSLEYLTRTRKADEAERYCSSVLLNSSKPEEAALCLHILSVRRILYYGEEK